MGIRLAVKPTTLREANAFVDAFHRHHKPARGCISVVSVVDGRGKTRGVGILGRPVSRRLQDGWTAEVTRVCTDGAPNACSMIYGALCRAARSLGYRRVITYTLPDEGGVSLRASGFVCAGEAGGGSWNCDTRARTDAAPTDTKWRWEKTWTS